MTNFKMN